MERFVTDNQSKDMQEKHTVRTFIQSDPATKKKPEVVYEYRCTACRQLVAQTYEKMDELGVQEKMRAHKCLSLGKKDFEEEIR